MAMHRACAILAVVRKVQLSYSFADAGSRAASIRIALIELLGAVREHGSITAAAKALGFSYRYVWGELKRWESELGHSLVVWEKGHRARGRHRVRRSRACAHAFREARRCARRAA